MSGNQALRKALFMSWSYGYLQGCIDGRPYPAEKDLEPLIALAAPATAQLSEEFLRDVLEITDGHLGKIIRRVAKGEGNKDGLWEHVNRQANALLRSQPAGTEE